MVRNSSRFLALVTSLMMLSATSIPSASSAISENAGATAVNFFWQAPSVSQMTWITRDVVVTKSGEGTYFSIIGNWNPPFYLGVQEYRHPRAGGRNKIAIFSAWDTYDKNNCTTCGPESRPVEGRTVVKDLGPGVYSGGFGYEGTGAQGFMWDFDWKIGDRIRAVVNLRPVSDGTEISAALQLNDSKWRYFATYKFSKKFNNLEPGYSFIEDFIKSPRTVRAAEYGNTWMENEDLSVRTPINFVQARANTDPNTQYHLIKQLNPTGLWAQVGGDEFVSKREFVPAKIDVSEEFFIPLEARVAALNLSGDAEKNYEVKYLQDKTNRELRIKAAAEKAAAEKAAADAQALVDSSKKSIEDLNSKLSALLITKPDLKSVILKVQTALNLIEVPISENEVFAFQQELLPIQKQIQALEKLVSITCIKGKVIKKVSAKKPVCPKGYKIKK